MESAEVNRSRLRLARCETVGRHLNAMIERVAKQMNERIADFIDHGTIKLRFGSRYDEIDFFVQLLGDVPHHPREPVKYRFNRHHPKL
ncbi:hypothetical protein D3C84_1120690 [compost metagenome]